MQKPYMSIYRCFMQKPYMGIFLCKTLILPAILSKSLVEVPSDRTPKKTKITVSITFAFALPFAFPFFLTL